MRSAQYVERLAVREAKLVNRDLYQRLVSNYPHSSYQDFAWEARNLIVQAFLDSIILGYAYGRRKVFPRLQLSLEDRLNRLLLPEELAFLRMQFEAAASQWSRPATSRLIEVVTEWSRRTRFYGWDASQAAKALNIAMRASGYSPITARNLQTLFRTGFHSGVNGVAYVETRYNPKVWGYRYVTAQDEKVRVSHQAQNGVTLPKEHVFWSVWWPPNGWNCRCTIEVLFKVYSISLGLKLQQWYCIRERG